MLNLFHHLVYEILKRVQGDRLQSLNHPWIDGFYLAHHSNINDLWRFIPASAFRQF